MGAPGVGHCAMGRTESMWDTVFSVCRPVYPPRARFRNLPSPLFLSTVATTRCSNKRSSAIREFNKTGDFARAVVQVEISNNMATIFSAW